MAAKKKGKGKKKIPAVVLIGGAVGALVLVMYLANSKKKKAASTTSSDAVQGVGYASGAAAIEQPNSYAATPTIQNYSTTSSTATPSHVHFHQKGKTVTQSSAPTSPVSPPRASTNPVRSTSIVTATGKESMAAIARGAGITENQLLSMNPSNESVIKKFWGTGKPVPKGTVWHT